MIQLLILIGGLCVVFLTDQDTLGWIITAIGAVLLVLPFLFLGLFAGMFRKAMKDDDFFTTTHGRTINRTRRR